MKIVESVFWRDTFGLNSIFLICIIDIVWKEETPPNVPKSAVHLEIFSNVLHFKKSILNLPYFYQNPTNYHEQF